MYLSTRDKRSCRGRILKTCTPSWNFTRDSEHGNAKPEPQTCLTNKNTFSNHVLLILFCLLCVMRKGKRTAVYAHQKISSGDGLDEFWWNLVRTLYHLKPLQTLYSLTSSDPWKWLTWTTDELVRWKRH